MRDRNDHVQTGRHGRGHSDPWQQEREREERAVADAHATHDQRAVSIMEQAVARWLGPAEP